MAKTSGEEMRIAKPLGWGKARGGTWARAEDGSPIRPRRFEREEKLRARADSCNDVAALHHGHAPELPASRNFWSDGMTHEEP